MSSSEYSSSDVEDDDGELLTSKIDEGINKVINAIKNDDPALFKKDEKFFPEIGEEGVEVKNVEKKVFLKDYQRERILEQANTKTSKDEPVTTYSDEQEKIRKDVIAQFNNTEEDDDDLLMKREGNEREIPEIELPDPEKDGEKFLSEFLEKKAWLPTKNSKVKSYNEIVENKEELDEFDEKSEQFETNYNFRFEDPDSVDIVSYARDQSTLRRGNLSSRQKRREREKEEKAIEEQKKKLEMSKIRKEKVNKVTNKLKQLQEALGDGEEKMAEILNSESLDGDWDDKEWDRRMQKLFDNEFYTRDDLNVDTKNLKRKAELIVDENEDLVFEKMLKPTGFRYREVEPESFGLSARDILLASDKDLNQFVGIKKLASYRDKEKVQKDRKKFGKQKRLRQWRKEVFGTEEEPSDEMWEKAKLEAAEAEGEKDEKPRKKKRRTK